MWSLEDKPSLLCVFPVPKTLLIAAIMVRKNSNLPRGGSKLLDQLDVMAGQANRTTQALTLVRQTVLSGAAGGF